MQPIQFKDLKTYSIGKVVTLHPELVKVFIDFGVDFCCGGDRNIMDAIEKDTNNTDSLIKASNTAIASAGTFNKDGNQVTLDQLTSEQLIEHILNNHHKYLKATLPTLSGLLFKILEVHGDRHPELFDIHKVFGSLKTELEGHLIKEEQQLFPMILKGNSNCKDLIDSLENEHDVAGDALHTLTDLTDHFKIPNDACTTYVTTFNMLKALVSDTYMHVHTENNILFKRV